MTIRTLAPIGLSAVLLTCAIAPLAAGQDQVAAARDLYASAAYEEALSALARAKEAPSADLEQIDQYRVFCLYALGQASEAETVAESLLRRDPLIKIDA